MKPIDSLRLLSQLVTRLRRHPNLWLATGALGFAALAVLGGRQYLALQVESATARLQPEPTHVEVVVARRDLRRGDSVSTETMAIRAIPEAYVPGGAVRPSDFDVWVGTRLRSPMRAGEPLLGAALAPVDPPNFSARVRPGIRALTVAVDEVNSLSGMLQPGDRIDLLLSVRPVGPAGLPLPELTRTVMQGVTVLATGRQARPPGSEESVPPRPFTAITVEVDPDQAQALVVAQRAGKLTAVLRNPEDLTRVNQRGLDVNALLGLSARTAAPSVPASARVESTPVELIVGGRGAVATGPGSTAASARMAAPAAATESSPLRSEGEAPHGRAEALQRLLRAEGASAPVIPEDLPGRPATVPLYR